MPAAVPGLSAKLPRPLRLSDRRLTGNTHMNVTNRARLLGLLCLVNAGGCMRPSSESRLSDLALARPVTAQSIWKVRVPLDAQLGNRMQRRLCTEFTLLEIYNEDDFDDFCRTVGLRPDQAHVNYSIRPSDQAWLEGYYRQGKCRRSLASRFRASGRRSYF